MTAKRKSKARKRKRAAPIKAAKPPRPISRERAVWLRAHEGVTKAAALAGGMPRALVEFELAQWMLADKEFHTGEDFGAKPRAIPFRQFVEWRAPIVNDGGPLRRRSEVEERASAEHVMREAGKCAELFRAVVWQLAIDLEPTWGTTKEERKWARLLFAGAGPYWRKRLEELASHAQIDPDALLSAHRAGRLRDLSRDTIGKRRWETRLANLKAAQAANPKPGQQMELAL